MAVERARVRQFGQRVRGDRAYIEKVKRDQKIAKKRNAENLGRVRENAGIIEKNQDKIRVEADSSRDSLRKQSERVSMEGDKYRKDAFDARGKSDKEMAGAKVAIRLAMHAHEYAIMMWWDGAERGLMERADRIRKFNNRIFGKQFATANAEDYELMAFSFGIRPEQLYPHFEEPSRYPDGSGIEQKKKDRKGLRAQRSEIEARLAKVQRSLKKDRASLIEKELEVDQWAKDRLDKQLDKRQKLLKAEKELLAQRDGFADTDERIEKGDEDVSAKERQYRKAARAVGI